MRHSISSDVPRRPGLEVVIRRACLVLALALTCAACSTHTSKAVPAAPASLPPVTTPATAASTTPPSALVSGSATPSALASTAAARTSTRPDGSTGCGASQLTLTVRTGDSGAGQFHQQLVLTNRGATCTLEGYPGVSFVDTAGQTLGKPAAQSPGPVHRQTLAPGGSVAAVLTYSNADAYPSSACHPRPSSRVRVYPPGDRLALEAADSVQVCSAPGTTQLHIGPVQAPS